MTEEIFRHELGMVTREKSIIRLRRTLGTPLNVALLDSLADQFQLLVPLRERKSLGLLIDMREAPLLIDDSFAQAVHHATGALIQGFPRSAFLVRTALGLLQIARRSRENQSPIRVFDNEQKAVAYLLGDDCPPH